jgi:hypothetical protein
MFYAITDTLLKVALSTIKETKNLIKSQFVPESSDLILSMGFDNLSKDLILE